MDYEDSDDYAGDAESEKLEIMARLEDEEPPDYYPGDDPYADSADQDDEEE